MYEIKSNINDSKQLIQWLINKNWNEVELYLNTISKDKYTSWEYLAKGFLEEYIYKNLDKSKQNIEKASLLSANDGDFFYTFADILLKLKKFELALNIALKAVSIKPDNPRYSFLVARTALVNNKYDIAYKSAKTASNKLSSNDTFFKKQISQMLQKTSPLWTEPLKGKNISLVRISTKHKGFLLKSRRNAEFQHHYNLFTSDSEFQLEKDIKLATKPPLDIGKIEWIIEKDNQPIGIAALADLDMHNKRAELLIGFPDKKVSRNSFEATLLVLEFAFIKIKLEKLISYVYSDNDFAQKGTMSLGFTQEGYLKSHVYDVKSNKRLDLYVNGCLSDDFFKNEKFMKMANRFLGRSLVSKKIKYSKLNFKK